MNLSRIWPVDRMGLGVEELRKLGLHAPHLPRTWPYDAYDGRPANRYTLQTIRIGGDGTAVRVWPLAAETSSGCPAPWDVWWEPTARKAEWSGLFPEQVRKFEAAHAMCYGGEAVEWADALVRLVALAGRGAERYCWLRVDEAARRYEAAGPDVPPSKGIAGAVVLFHAPAEGEPRVLVRLDRHAIQREAAKVWPADEVPAAWLGACREMEQVQAQVAMYRRARRVGGRRYVPRHVEA